jgi:hypothetical protein
MAKREVQHTNTEPITPVHFAIYGFINRRRSHDCKSGRLLDRGASRVRHVGGAVTGGY